MKVDPIPLWRDDNDDAVEGTCGDTESTEERARDGAVNAEEGTGAAEERARRCDDAHAKDIGKCSNMQRELNLTRWVYS